MKPVFIREASPEVTAKVDYARSIIRGNGSFNIESVMLYLAENHDDLLKAITVQCDTNERDRDFWRQELCNPLPREDGVGASWITRQEWLQILWGFTVLLHDARRFLRVHQGNPVFASTQLMRDAVKRCKAGNLERTPELLKASMLMGIITAHSGGNKDGENNQLLRYMAENVKRVEMQMSWFTASELSIGFMEAHFNGTTHSTLTSGWL